MVFDVAPDVLERTLLPFEYPLCLVGVPDERPYSVTCVE
jgi:hypothetical protein